MTWTPTPYLYGFVRLNPDAGRLGETPEPADRSFQSLVEYEGRVNVLVHVGRRTVAREVRISGSFFGAGRLGETPWPAAMVTGRSGLP